MKDHFTNAFKSQETPVELSEEEKRERLFRELITTVPERFNQYAADIAIMAKHTDTPSLLGVTYDKSTDTVIGAPVYERDRFRSWPPIIHGSMAREMSSIATVESDVVAYIERDVSEVDGRQEELYLLSLRRYNAETRDDTWNNYRGEDGLLLMQVALRASKEEVIARVMGRPDGKPNSDQLANTLTLLNKSIPKTT